MSTVSDVCVPCHFVLDMVFIFFSNLYVIKITDMSGPCLLKKCQHYILTETWPLIIKFQLTIKVHLNRSILTGAWT